MTTLFIFALPSRRRNLVTNFDANGSKKLDRSTIEKVSFHHLKTIYLVGAVPIKLFTGVVDLIFLLQHPENVKIKLNLKAGNAEEIKTSVETVQ